MRVIHWLLELFFPTRCVLCGKCLKRGEMDLCEDCRKNILMCRSGGRRLQFLDSWTAVWYYEGYVRRSLLRYKFRGRRGYAQSYGRLLAMKLLQEYPEGFDLITWVPISSLRKLRRGYDQVELLTKAVSPELGIPAEKLLVKFRDNRANSDLKTPAERRANVLGVYKVPEGADIRGKRVLLLDDIVTTGATASECARVLLTAGAEEVCFAAVAAAGTTSSK